MRKLIVAKIWTLNSSIKPVFVLISYLQAINQKNYDNLTAKNYTDFQLCFLLEQ